ncbi:MAG TPA: exodeoxyribonuclease VII large subunit [Candidatus Saccharimonadia bacterium]|nr:exodeoxyribonuclease VII large subunit [Candidatus Saccharimonadia bacterium]
MSPQVISVSEFLAIINETLGFAYPQVVVEGEVSSFKVNQGKFVFFDLKDEQNVLSCFMMLHQLKLPLEDGMKVRLTGSPKVTRFSKFSLTVRAVELAGEGELRRAMELLKRKLAAEGLFEAARKRPLPAFPRRIGLITSGASAAYSDFIKILNARWGGVVVQLADVSVQGQTAADQIVAALEYFNGAAEPADVIALIRGGGSLEDLAAFSTEPVARAVAASRTPIIVGVGHEIDTSLADYTADVRAATPTDAARLIVPDRSEVRARVLHLVQRAEAAFGAVASQRLAQTDQALARLERQLRAPRERVQTLRVRLWHELDRLHNAREQRLDRTESLQHRLTMGQTARLAERWTHLAGLQRALRSFDPQATLDRGYAIVRQDGAILRDPATAQAAQPLMIQLAKGNLTAEVSQTHDH